MLQLRCCGLMALMKAASSAPLTKGSPPTGVAKRVDIGVQSGRFQSVGIDSVENILGEMRRAGQADHPIAPGNLFDPVDHPERHRAVPDHQGLDIFGAVIIAGRQTQQFAGGPVPSLMGWKIDPMWVAKKMDLASV